MSQANVEMVKRTLDAYNQRDLVMYDDLCTPDFEWFPALMGIIEGESFWPDPVHRSTRCESWWWSSRCRVVSPSRGGSPEGDRSEMVSAA